MRENPSKILSPDCMHACRPVGAIHRAKEENTKRKNECMAAGMND